MQGIWWRCLGFRHLRYGKSRQGIDKYEAMSKEQTSVGVDENNSIQMKKN
jgi:hypothetical protein